MTVYFIQAGKGGPIKIGHAKDVQRRLAGFQTGSPVTMLLLCTMDGGAAEERALHLRFAAHRERGEWFSPGAELLSFVQSLPPCIHVAPARKNRAIGTGPHADLIHQLGGTSALARALEVRTAVVLNWLTRPIPHHWRIPVAKLALTAGIQLPANFFSARPGRASTPVTLEYLSRLEMAVA